MSRGGLYAGLYASQGMSLSVVGDVDGIGKSVVKESIEEEEKKRRRRRSQHLPKRVAKKTHTTD